MTPHLVLPSWMWTVEQARERERILASSYCLVRIRGNGGIGEALKCDRCGGKHEFFSLNCISRPFAGLEKSMYAYYTTSGLLGAKNFLSPEQKRRHEQLGRMLGITKDLGESHPEWARKIATPEHDTDLGAVAIGIVEPITRKQALDRARAINMRGCKPRFTLPGLEREI